MRRVFLWLLVAASTCGAAAAQESRPSAAATFVFSGRVLFDAPRNDARVAITSPRGDVAEGTCASDGAFEISIATPPDGLRIRVSTPDAAPVFFDAPGDVRSGTTRLGVRDARARRGDGRASGTNVRAPPGSEVVVYDATRGASVDARDALFRGAVDAEGGVAFPDAKVGFAIYAIAGANGCPAVAVAPAREGSVDLSAALAAASPAVLDSDAIGATFAGFYELPFFAPLTGAPTKLRVDGVVDARAIDGVAVGAIDVPPGAVFEGFVRVGEVDRLVRGFGGAPLGVAAEIPARRRSPRAVDAATDAPIDARATIDGMFPAAGPPASFAASYVALRVEPTHDGLFERGAACDDAAPGRGLRRRTRAYGFGPTNLGKGVVYWRRASGAPETAIAFSDDSGALSPTFVPGGAGELLMRFASATSGPAPVAGGSERDEPVAFGAPRDRGGLAGRVFDEGRGVAGAAVFLVPTPDDRDLLSEFWIPARFRDAVGRAAFEDVRVVGTTTDVSGRFVCEAVDQGSYVLVVEAPGRYPFVAPDVSIPGESIRDVSIEGAPRETSERSGPKLSLETRGPYGPSRVVASADDDDAPRAIGGGFRLSSETASIVPDPSGDRVVDVRFSGGGAGPVTARAFAEDVGAGCFAATEKAKDGKVRFRFSGTGRVVVQAATPGAPWTTFGPFLPSDPKDSRPFAVELKRGRRVVGRAREPDGRLAADAAVRAYPEVWNVLRGAEPDPILGRVDADGSILLPPLPFGRVALEIDGRFGRFATTLHDVSDERLGDAALVRSDEGPASLSADARARSADRRFLDADEVLRRRRSRFAVETTAPLRPRVETSTPPAAIRGVGPVAEFATRLSAPPLFVALPGYVPGSEVVLTPFDGEGATTAAAEFVGGVDGRGDARFRSVPAGRYLVSYADPNGARDAFIVVEDSGERRVVVPRPTFGRGVAAPFDMTGTRRLIGATVVAEPIDRATTLFGRRRAGAPVVVAGDGRAEFEAEAGRPLAISVRCPTTRNAGLFFFDGLAEGKTAPDAELMTPRAVRVAVHVTAGRGPELPLPGATVAVFLAGYPWAFAVADSEGVARFDDVPGEWRATIAASADGYVRTSAEISTVASGDFMEARLHLPVADRTTIRFAPGESGKYLLLFDEAVAALDPRRSAPDASLAAFADRSTDLGGAIYVPTARGVARTQVLHLFRSADDPNPRIVPLPAGEDVVVGPP